LRVVHNHRGISDEGLAAAIARTSVITPPNGRKMIRQAELPPVWPGQEWKADLDTGLR